MEQPNQPTTPHTYPFFLAVLTFDRKATKKMPEIKRQGGEGKKKGLDTRTARFQASPGNVNGILLNHLKMSQTQAMSR